MRILKQIFPLTLVVIAVLFAIMTVYIASQRPLTSLESVLLQAITLITGLAGSFLFGKQSSKDAARNIIKPHARSAFRRLISLYESLSRVASEIQTYQNNKENHEITIARLDVIVIGQLNTADDALEDWRDIVPEDVEELKEKLEILKHMRHPDE